MFTAQALNMQYAAKHPLCGAAISGPGVSRTSMHTAIARTEHNLKPELTCHDHSSRLRSAAHSTGG